MRKLIMVCCLLILGTNAFALSALTEEGRLVALDSNGTWEYLKIGEAEDWRTILQFIDFTVNHDWVARTGGPFGDTVFCYPQFKNMTTKVITGLVLNLRYLDVTGDMIHEEKALKYNVLIKPGQTNPTESYLYYEKNDRNSAYLKLKDAAMAGTMKITLCIKRIVFSDGSNLNFSNEIWQARSAAASKYQ